MDVLNNSGGFSNVYSVVWNLKRPVQVMHTIAMWLEWCCLQDCIVGSFSTTGNNAVRDLILVPEIAKLGPG